MSAASTPFDRHTDPGRCRVAAQMPADSWLATASTAWPVGGGAVPDPVAGMPGSGSPPPSAIWAWDWPGQQRGTEAGGGGGEAPGDVEERGPPGDSPPARGAVRATTAAWAGVSRASR